MTDHDDDPYGRNAAFEAALAARAEQAARNIAEREQAQRDNVDPQATDLFDQLVAERVATLNADNAPEPLIERLELPEWPTHILPAWIAEHVHATSERLQVPPDLCAQLAVGVLASLTMSCVDVTVGDWTEPTNLFLYAAMHSGAGKSPAEKAMVGPLRKWERDRRLQLDHGHQVAKAEHRVAQKRLKEAEAQYAKNAIGLAEFEDAVLEAAEPEPVEYRLTVDDTTPERLTQLLAGHRNLALISTEAGLLDMVAGAYSQKMQANTDVYLKAWAGETIIRDRKGGDGGPERTVVENAHLSVVLCIQPSIIEKYQQTQPELRGRGFFARFMPSVPTSLVGQRTYGRRPPAGPEADTYATRIAALADLTAGAPQTLHLDAEAAEAFYKWCEDMETELGDGGRLEALHDASSKIRSSVLRLSAILAAADGADHVDEATVRRAIEVGDYWVVHAMSVEGIVHGTDMHDQATVDLAVRILDWCRQHNADEFTPREVYLSLRRHVRTVEELVPSIELLWRRKWLWFAEGTIEEIGTRGARVRARLHHSALAVATKSELTRAMTRTRVKEGKNTPPPPNSPHLQGPPDPARVARVLDPIDPPSNTGPTDVDQPDTPPVDSPVRDDDWFA